MRYIDSGTRDPSQALGTWLQQVLNEEIEQLRWQSGFFTASALGFFAPVFSRLAAQEGKTVLLIGSNEGNTVRDDVELLMVLLGVPRPGAHLGVVSYSTSYFHPKTLHLMRSDGSEAAYVGSANLTRSGITAHHVEAGIVLDSREGDPKEILTGIGRAVDRWLAPGTSGIEMVEDTDDLDRLVRAGVLRESPAPRAAGATDGSNGGSGVTRLARPRLSQLLTVPALPTGQRGTGGSGVGVGARVAGANSGGHAAANDIERARVSEASPVVPAPRSAYPEYLLFSPGASAPTVGAGALSGASLPSGAAGLIVKLNRDSARHFVGREGTSNISVPVATLSSIQFGIFKGKYKRPRAEFGLETRYIADDGTLSGPSAPTNIMAYGFEPGETGHRDVRLVLPAAVRSFAESIVAKGRVAPSEGDVALLEWPSPSDPIFRISFMDPGSALHGAALALYDKAGEEDTRVGDGACWLPPGLSPRW